MDLIHLQLNTSSLRSPEEIMQFILDKDVNVACLQEIVYPLGDWSPLRLLAEENGFSYVEGIHFRYLPKKVNVGVAILSKFPIIDHFSIYYNSANYQPKDISGDEILGNLLDNVPSDYFPGSRGLINTIKSRCVLTGIIQLEGNLARIITTNFTVSDLCTETRQMFEMAEMLHSLVKNSKELPLILSGDLNIRAESFSIHKLKEVMTIHTDHLTDTLSNSHIAKKNDFPEGLAVDHVFSTGLNHLTTETEQISFSDHKALLSTFVLN